jgi:hypothetical protein
MVVLLHGVAGGWDELAIAVVALVVLWVAVKLAGRKPATEAEEDEFATAVDKEERKDPAHSSST